MVDSKSSLESESYRNRRPNSLEPEFESSTFDSEPPQFPKLSKWGFGELLKRFLF